MKEFVFVKKSKLYRKSLYYLLYVMLFFQIVLMILNFALINKETNYFFVLFNILFLSAFVFILYKHIIPRFKYKIVKAEYKWFKIKNEMLIVKYNDNSVVGYNFVNQNDCVKKIQFQTILKDTINSVNNIAYNINIKLSDGKVVNAIMPLNKAKQLVSAVPNSAYVKDLSQEIKNDAENFKSVLKTKNKHIPSFICFGVSAFVVMFTLIIFLGYSTTKGTYYASELVKANPKMPVNTYTYSVQQTTYTNKEDYTISFGDNVDKDILVFYRADNPQDSYSMYTIDFLIFIALTFMVIGGILLNNVYSPYLAVFGLSIMPFYLIRLLNLSVASLFSSQLLIPVLSLLSIPIYLFISAILKIATDIIKFWKEKKLLKN